MKTIRPQIFVGLVLLTTALAQARETNNVAIASYAQNFVAQQGDSLVPFKPGKFLSAPYTALYFGAGWCPDCRRFSPALVAAYDGQTNGERRFEVLLLTMDKTPEAMLKFMRSEKMRWPALAFDKMAGAEALKKYYSGQGIPCLSVVDQKGAVVLQSKSDQDATEILNQLEVLLKDKK
jgi:thiol-disulfide isomerase/thioredoxin